MAVLPIRSGWLWLGAAALVGFTIPAVFAGILEWPRRWFVLPLVVAETVLLWAWWRSMGEDWRVALQRRRAWTLLASAMAAAFTVNNVMGQPPSSGAMGWLAAWDILWLGGVYGTVDALLLTVLPVNTIWVGLEGHKGGWARRVGVGALALAASLALTATYHFGYPEFRSAAIAGPLIGNAVLTVAYLATFNPLAPVLAHVAMHVAAVWFAFDTALQLPPHY
jgi:hypothetical protein